MHPACLAPSASHGRLLLADKTGSGKTVQAITLAACYKVAFATVHQPAILHS